MRITKIERADPKGLYHIEARTQNGRVWRLFAFDPSHKGRQRAWRKHVEEDGRVLWEQLTAPDSLIKAARQAVLVASKEAGRF